MAALSPPMDKFHAAMHQIYQFPTSNASSWTPPPMSEGHRGRYLWTDAFAVVNFITLHKQTSDAHYLGLAKSLIQTVHDILGRARDGNTRLPNATDDLPLQGGLRIGKEDATGPDGDGQYHHYLTIWMFALNRMSIASRDKSYNDQAISLAKAIHPHFVYSRNSSRPRMHWKMSVDLSRPLVRSEGHLDPFDGYLVFRLLQSHDGQDSQVLTEEIEDYRRIVEIKSNGYQSDDPLDLGMTLWTAHWFDGEEGWATKIAKAARRDVETLFEEERYFEMSLRVRLAFREFGTCLGVQCSERGADLRDQVMDVITTWESDIMVPVKISAKLLPITLVMYAAALMPGAFRKDFV